MWYSMGVDPLPARFADQNNASTWFRKLPAAAVRCRNRPWYGCCVRSRRSV